MDKQRVIELAHDIARRNEERLGNNNPQHIRLYGEPVRMIKLIDSGFTEFAAAILIEISKQCHFKAVHAFNSSSQNTAFELRDQIMQIAKELTE